MHAFSTAGWGLWELMRVGWSGRFSVKWLGMLTKTRELQRDIASVRMGALVLLVVLGALVLMCERLVVLHFLAFTLAYFYSSLVVTESRQLPTLTQCRPSPATRLSEPRPSQQ
jgi:hypothetical protein